MISQRPVGTRAVTGCLWDGGARGTWPGRRFSVGLRLAGVVGWALVAAAVATADVQYRDRNGQTWSAPNQIDRQRREDNQARQNANSAVANDDKLRQELAAYWSQHQAWEEGARRMHEESDRWNEEMRRERKALEIKRAAVSEAIAKGKVTAEQARIAATILRAARAGGDVQADPQVNYEVVAGLAEGLITGTFRGQTLAQLEINYSARERYEMALKLYGKAGSYEGRKENRGRNFEAGAYGFDLIHRAGLVAQGRGLDVVNELRRKHYLFEEDHWQKVFVGLGCALATPKNGLDPEQRQQATLLLADYMGRAALSGHDGAAMAFILVSAALQTPELRQVPALREKIIPAMRNTVWEEGLESWPTPMADAKPLHIEQTRSAYWCLSAMLVLADGYTAPLPWFASLRDERRRQRVAPATAAEKATIQRALDGWLARRGVLPGVRPLIQADCDLACDTDVAGLAGSAKWDETMRGLTAPAYETWEDRDKRLAAGVAALRNPAFLSQVGAKAFLALAPLKSYPGEHSPIDGLIYTYLGDACAEGPDHATRVLTALRWMTEIDDAVSFREMPRGKWETLVKLGEGFCEARDPQWTDPSVGARLARLRIERLGDEAGAQQWLAGPGRQPGDGDAPEKWREWATLAGRPGIRIAAQRHPEHFTEPVLLRRALAAVSGNDNNGLSPAARVTVAALIARAAEMSDPETVLAIAKVRGFVLGDWAKLGVWLDEPRRRPKGPDDPLYPLFVNAIMERDQAEGLLSDSFFEARGYGAELRKLEQWLDQVLAAKGQARKKLIEENFPSVIYCREAASAYPDLRMLGYDAARGGFASRALLLLSTAEFNPEDKIVAGSVIVDGDDGKPERLGGYDAEPWLAAVAKLPRSVPAEVLLAQLAAGVQARLDWRAKVEALRSREVPPGLSKEESEKLDPAKSPEYQALVEDGRRSGWVGEGCQQALARLAERWSPVREFAQAAILARGDQLLLDQDDLLVHAPGIAARVKWEQSKMRGLDDAQAFAVASAGLSAEDLRITANMTHALVLQQDEGFDAQARAAAAAVAAR